MDAIPAGLILETIVCVLLAATIGYCALLDGKLKAMRKGQNGLRGIVQQLNTSTEQAILAIRQLRQASDASGQELSARVEEARALTEELSILVRKAQAAGLLHGASLKSDDEMVLASAPAIAPRVHVPVAAPRAVKPVREHKPVLQQQLLDRLRRAGNGA